MQMKRINTRTTAIRQPREHQDNREKRETVAEHFVCCGCSTNTPHKAYVNVSYTSSSYSFEDLYVVPILQNEMRILKKNQNAPRPSEHPPLRGKNVKTFRWDHSLGCKYKTSSWHLNGFPYGGDIGPTV